MNELQKALKRLQDATAVYDVQATTGDQRPPLVETLRMYGWKRENDATCGPVMRDAADEIERLRRLLNDLARAADTAELLLRRDYPGEASSLRCYVSVAANSVERSPVVRSEEGNGTGQKSSPPVPSVGEEDRASNKDAIDYLGDVLYVLADLHPDDRCKALDNALAFYNAARPTQKAAPSGLSYQRLVSTLPGAFNPTAALPQHGWQDISSAPKDGSDILWYTRDSDGDRYAVIYWPEYSACFEEGHWQRLPPPPAKEGE